MSDNDLIFSYHEKGLSIFPLRANKKTPAVGSWAIWQERRPTKEEVTSWCKNNQIQNVAIVTGQVSGYIVLDEDNPPVFRAWLKEHGYQIPATATVKTSTYQDAEGNTQTKFHYYFKHPGGKIKNMIKKIPGADIKGDGGYVVAPPSIHPKTGEPYEWCFGMSLDDYPDTPVPPWLLEHLNREVSAVVPLAQGDLLPPDKEDWMVVALRGVPKGERDDAAISLAGYYVAKGESEARTLETLRGWNLRNPEPLPDKQLIKCVASGARMEYRKQIKAGAKEGKPEAETNGKVSEEERRQAMIEGLGGRLGLPISDIRSTLADESVWEIFMGADHSVVVTGDQLAEQRLFRKKFINSSHKLPKKIVEPKGGGAWDDIIDNILKLAICQDVGEGSTALGQLKEFLNAQIENYHGLAYFNSSQTIPPHCSWFIVQRKAQNPTLFCRIQELFIESKIYGYKSIKQMAILMPSLGHESERFSWNRKTVRAWAMDMDKMSEDIKTMVYQLAIAKKEEDQ